MTETYDTPAEKWKVGIEDTLSRLTEFERGEQVAVAIDILGGGTDARDARVRSNTIGRPEFHRFGNEKLILKTSQRSDAVTITVWPDGAVRMRSTGSAPVERDGRLRLLERSQNGG